ncbi:MAG: hypothetical protein H6712_02025 [Myxococcales bacterium]|nr:hypothetical protein [Myxococcales bacterium]MCB9712605.1 hypothetical protein [Myxococcales bacterium]
MAREYIELVEDFLGAPSDERIEIYLYADSPPQCALVCYTPEGYIAANWNALDHEVVHAVVARFADPAPFWNEGIAEVLTKRGTDRCGQVSVTDNVSARESTEVDYATAGHFVRWLVETRGIEPVLDVLEDVPVEQALGETLGELAAEHGVDAPSTSSTSPTADTMWCCRRGRTRTRSRSRYVGSMAETSAELLPRRTRRGTLGERSTELAPSWVLAGARTARGGWWMSLPLVGAGGRNRAVRKALWARLGEAMPDYEDRKEALRKLGPRLHGR